MDVARRAGEFCEAAAAGIETARSMHSPVAEFPVLYTMRYNQYIYIYIYIYIYSMFSAV